MKKLLTVREYATHRGVSPQAIRYAMKKGRIFAAKCPTHGRSTSSCPCVTKFDQDESDADWKRNTGTVTAPQANHPGRAAGTGGDSAPSGDRYSYREAQAKEKHFRAQLRQIEYEKKAGRLIPAERVVKAWSDILAVVGSRLADLPDVLAREVADEDDEHEVREILRKAVRSIRVQLSADVRGLIDE